MLDNHVFLPVSHEQEKPVAILDLEYNLIKSVVIKNCEKIGATYSDNDINEDLYTVDLEDRAEDKGIKIKPLTLSMVNSIKANFPDIQYFRFVNRFE